MATQVQSDATGSAQAYYGDTSANTQTNGSSTTNGPSSKTGVQGQSTGADGDGPDWICKLLDKLEKKFGGERFNNPDNDAKNQAMNQKVSARAKTIGPMVLKKLPQVLPMILSKIT